MSETEHENQTESAPETEMDTESFASGSAKNLTYPVSRVLEAADSGALFRAPLGNLLKLMAILAPIAGIALCYNIIDKSDSSWAVDMWCGENGEKYEEAKANLAKVEYEWEKGSYELEISQCEEAREEAAQSSLPFILLFGFFVSSLGVAQVLWYRASKLEKKTSTRYPVTPLLAFCIKVSGECLAVSMAIMGVFGSLQAMISSSGSQRYLDGPLELIADAELAGILAGPAAGLAILLATHYVAELSVALVAIANNTEKEEA